MTLIIVWFKLYGTFDKVNNSNTIKFSKIMSGRFGNNYLKLDWNSFLLKFPLNDRYDSEIVRTEIEPHLIEVCKQSKGSYGLIISPISNPPENYLRLPNQRWLEQQPDEN